MVRGRGNPDAHGTSGRDHRRQPAVAADVAGQVAGGRRGVVGVMIESFLPEWRQDLTPGVAPAYGLSITDGCLGWDTTESVLDGLAGAVRARRAAA